jgi:hypothetical protein
MSVALAGCTFLVDFVSKDEAPCEGEACADGGMDVETGTIAGDVDVPPAPDAAPDACCGCVDVTLGESNAHFRSIENAQFRGSYVELTTEAEYRAGGVFWTGPAGLTTFDVRFDVSLTRSKPDAAPADGVAFVALNGISPSQVTCDTSLGSNFCVLGKTKGFGVLLRTFSFDPPAVPYVAVIRTDRPLDGDGGALIDGGARSISDATVALVDATGSAPPERTWHTLAIHVDKGRASVRMDDAGIVSNVAVPVFADGGTWGIVASTGQYFEYAAVRNLHMVDVSASCDAGR